MTEDSNSNQPSGAAGSGIPSPCDQTCKLSPDGEICEGCYRTFAEIVEWAMYTEDQKQEVMLRVADRRVKH